MKNKKIRKYIKHFCLLFVGIFTCFITTLSVSAATRGFAFRAFRLDGAIRWRTYVASTNLTINGGKFISLSDGIIAFCIEPGLEALLIEDGVYDINTNTSSFSSITGYSPDTLNDLELISFFGYGFNGDTSDEMYMATQLEIWERVSPNTVAQSYGDFSTINAKRNQIRERVNKAKVKPSFDMTTKDIALNEEVSFTDNNGVLKDFVVSSCTNCTARIDGNTLKVVSTSIGKAKVSLSRKFSNSDVGSILYTKGTHQKLMTFSHPAISISNLNLNTYGGKIKITKVDSETNTTTPQGQASLVGATYNVYDSNNNVVSSLTIGSDKTATTDYLPLGTYTIKEVASSTGYYVDGTTYKAEITNSNIVNITVKETVIKGKIKINKYDSETNSCKAQGQATLVGAKYGIFDYNNNLVDTLTIDSNCSATSKSLPYGNYTIKELESSNGYYIDGTTYKANITNSNTIAITSKEDIIKGQIKINKIDSETNSCKAQGQATLVGAKYGIFDYNNNLVDTLIIDNNCSATSNLLPFGNYTIKELNAPTGYEIDTNIYSANIINSNIINITSKENVIKGKIKITKVDSENNTTTPQGEATLIGAKYGVYDYNNNLVDTLTIGNDSTATSKLLPYGNYTIKELENSKGYYLNTEIYSEFIEQAIDYSLTVNEDVIKNDFEFYKFYGNVDTGFIYAEPNATFNVLNNNDQIVLTFTTDKNGYAKITLPYGNYKLYQIKGLDDYKLMFPFSIRVNEDTSLNQVNYLKNGSIIAKLKLIKIDSETNLPIKLAGIKFKIRNKETNEFVCQTTNKVICEFETDENGVMITPLPLFGGDYLIEEIKAPTGYLLSNKSVEFSIKENTEIIEDSIYGSLIEVEFENKAVKGKIEINKTGEKVVIENGSFKYETINDLSNAICEEVNSRDKYWQESSSSVLSALCLALIEDAKTENQIHFHSIYNLLVEHGAKKCDDENSLDKYFSDRPFGNTAKNLYSSGNFARGETRATIFSILAAKLRVFGDTGVSYITSRTSFNMRDIGNKKTAIFLIVPDEKLSRHFIGGLFVNQVYQTLVEEAQKTPTGSLPIRVNFILEEFCNTIRIAEFSKKLTVARSRNIRIYSVIQDFGQLKESYKEQATTIKANCSTCYLLTNDYQSAREISNRLGKYTISTTRTSSSNRYGKADFNLSSDTSLTGRDLLTTDELINFKFGEALFLIARFNPIKSNLKQIKDYPIKYKVVDNITINQDKFYRLEIFDLDTFRIEKELFDLPEEQPKASPTGKKKKNASKQSKS